MRYCSLLSWVVMLAGIAQLAAHGEVSTVIVRGIYFEYYEARELDGRKWQCSVIELVGGAGITDARFASNVVVHYSMATEITTGRSAGELSYYRAKARIPAIERDEKVYIRFFLPPEIVRRDGVARAPVASLVELAVGGSILEFQPTNATGLIDSTERLSVYKAKLVDKAPINDGLLLPLDQTPFYRAGNNEFVGNSPTYLPY